MATRNDIKKKFRSELVSAVEDFVDADDVTLRFFNTPESLPAVSYREDIRDVPINAASASPERVEYDNNGNVVGEYFHEYQEARFTVYIAGQNANETEEIYEAVHRAFHKYNLGGWDKKDFHEHLFDFGIRVESGRPSDDSAADNVVRGEVVIVYIRFYREYELTGTPISTAEIDVTDSDDAIWFEFSVD